MVDEGHRQKRIELAKQLIDQLEADNLDEADRLIEDLKGPREFNLFQELGRLTRQLHESLVSFQYDSKISELAQKDIPDAKERLNYVISMTEQAANRTLDMVEASLPLADGINASAKSLGDSWGRFRAKEMSLDEFKTFSSDLSAFLESAASDSKKLHENMSEMLMAQGFQDLTGQLIRRVITLVHEVEENMVGIIKISGMGMPLIAGATEVVAEESTSVASQLEGPQVNPQERDDVVQGQDDVDDLLKSLGF